MAASAGPGACFVGATQETLPQHGQMNIEHRSDLADFDVFIHATQVVGRQPVHHRRDAAMAEVTGVGQADALVSPIPENVRILPYRL